jgi:hypothetical protein
MLEFLMIRWEVMGSGNFMVGVGSLMVAVTQPSAKAGLVEQAKFCIGSELWLSGFCWS